jgi:VanZ family protein
MTSLQHTRYTGIFRLGFVSALLIVSYLSLSRIDAVPLLDALSIFSDKIQHAAAFFVLAFLLDFASPRLSWSQAKWLPLLGYGLLIEIVQSAIPYREFSLWDLSADGLGLLLYTVTLPLFRRTPGLAPRWNSVTN